MAILDSIVVSIPACHAGDRGSIPRRGGFFLVNRIQHRKDGYSHGYVNSLIVILITNLCFTLIQFYKTIM